MNARAPWLSSSERAALRFEGRTWSAAELAARADALAGWLASAGVGRGDVVAAHLPNGPDFATLLHALDRCDAILLPLNRHHPEPELRLAIEDSGAKLVVHADDALAARVRAATSGRPVRPLPRLAPESRPARPAAGADAPALLLYTSGTTGRPKGAVLSHANLRASVDASARHLGTAHDDVWLACLPFFHIGGLSILLRCAAQGCPVQVHAEPEASALASALDADGITHVSLVPTLLGRLLAARPGRGAPPKLRVVLLGGSGAPPPLLERAHAEGWPLAATYGLTETASQVATRLPGASPDAPLPPLPGVELRVVDDAGHALAPGTPGEILVRAACVFERYWNDPAATAAALRDGWLHTGDIGMLDAAGHLRVLDRRTDLIVSGGENIYPAEIERVLAEHPAISAAAVAGVPDAEWGQRPVAWWEGPEPAPDAEELRDFCRARLAGFKVPLRFHRVAALPRTPGGKLQRHRLEEPVAAFASRAHRDC